MRNNDCAHNAEPTWTSTDYFLTSFLLARGMKILGVDGNPPRRTFILHDPDPQHRQKLILSYQLGTDDTVSATSLFESQRKLQRLLRDAGA